LAKTSVLIGQITFFALANKGRRKSDFSLKGLRKTFCQFLNCFTLFSFSILCKVWCKTDKY